MRNITISQILSAERQKRKLSIADISRLTRIRLEYVQALESDHFEELPPAVFVKGYIKAYAQVLGLDEQPLLALLRRDFKQSARGQLIPREFIKPVLRRGMTWQPITIIGIALFFIFSTIMGYVAVQWYSLQQPPVLSVISPQDKEVVGPLVMVKGKTSTEALVSVNAIPVSLRPDGSFQTELTFLSEGITTITVEAEDKRGKKAVVQHSVQVQF